MKKIRTVYGVGINDSEGPVEKRAMAGGKKILLWCCPFYVRWREILARCYSEKCQRKNPTYIGCLAADEWHRFSVFKEWMGRQPWLGNHIDKDLLCPGNKVYGPDACVFVSQGLNNFLTDHARARGMHPIGVSFHGGLSKLRATCSNPFSGVIEHLGYFDCPLTAHEAWRARKHQHACQYADLQTDPRIAQALRTRYLADKEII
jgi:hypothetical protein